MKQLLPFSFLFYLLTACQVESTRPISSDPTDQKVADLLAQMTLEEKVGQLNMYTGFWEFTGPVPQDSSTQQKLEAIQQGRVGAMLNVFSAEATQEAQKQAVENSRLGIPLLFGYDVIHGYKTMFPVPIAQAASWDYETARLGAEVAARETAAAGIHWTFAPMIDISRDARWGRIMESAGEDPHLTSIMAEAWVKGFQGEDLSDTKTIAACAKHFAAYGFAEAGREYNTVEISENTLYNVVLPPFKAAADAGAATFMNAFNDLNGVPATGSRFLQRDILKGDWDYKGLVVSDWASIFEMVEHGFVSNEKEAAKVAIEAGSDMDMESHAYEKYLEDLIKEGKVDEKLLDDAVSRILKLKFDLGLFDDPYKYSDLEREKSEMLSEQNLEAARKAARETFVLLKNENQLLPLSPSTKSIAVIGDLGDSKDDPLGNWRAQANNNSAVSLLEGIENAVSEGASVSFEQGYKLTEGRRGFVFELEFVEDDRSGFADAIALAKRSEVVVMAMGEDCLQSGEGRSQVSVALKGEQEALLKEIVKVNQNVVVVLMTGRPVAIPEVAEIAPAILQVWYGGSEAGNAMADVLFGKHDPAGRLPASFPRHTGQEPLHYDRKSTGRPFEDKGIVFWSHYTDSPNTPLFPFGFGLTYTSFEYSNLRTEAKGETIAVRIDLANTGDRAGTETVQVYIRDVAASWVQPIKKLVAFRKVKLQPAEKQTVSFTLTEKELGFYHADRSFYAEPGEFKVMVGANAEELMQQSVVVGFLAEK